MRGGGSRVVTAKSAPAQPSRSSAAAVAPEKRTAADGKSYTKADFFTFFAGYTEWDAAKPAAPPAPPVAKPPPAPPKPVAPEKRTAADGKSYTKADFFTFFAGYAEWDAAKPGGTEPTGASAAPGADGGGGRSGRADGGGGRGRGRGRGLPRGRG